MGTLFLRKSEIIPNENIIFLIIFLLSCSFIIYQIVVISEN